jgi:hypothetical protein
MGVSMRDQVGDNGSNGSGNGSGGSGLRLFVILRAINFDRVTEGFLRCALARGHTVHVGLEQRKAGFADDHESLFHAIARDFPNFSFDRLAPREDIWLYPATRLRAAIDYIRYFEPGFERAETLRDRARTRAPWYAKVPAALHILRVGPMRRGIDRFLRAIERRLPISEQSVETLREFDPDVVVVSPLVEIGSSQGDQLRAADRLGIPTAYIVASWDNLTTKGAIRDDPDLTLVWNEDQIREAVDMHGLAPETVRAVGAHSHDHWFSWKPSTSRESFAEKVGLGADRPFLLYVCSSGFIAGDDEVEFVRQWRRRLTESGVPELMELGILIRPHPQNVASWAEADLDEPGKVVVWPRGGAAPTDRQKKDEYFDSLHHASAVVGINTTALIDSAIVRRPVFTIVSEDFASTQTGTLHFSYLASDDGGGLLNVAHSWEEHCDQVGRALRAPADFRVQIDDFLLSFVRPHGLERAAAPLALEAVEETATIEKEAVSPGGPLRWIVGVSAAGLGHLHRLRLHMRPAAVKKRRAKRKKERRRERALREKARASSKANGKPASATKVKAPPSPAEPQKPKPPKTPLDKEARAREKAARAAMRAANAEKKLPRADQKAETADEKALRAARKKRAQKKAARAAEKEKQAATRSPG